MVILIAIVGVWMYVSQRPLREACPAAGRHGGPHAVGRCRDRRRTEPLRVAHTAGADDAAAAMSAV